jgi:hypothetical protein
VGLEIIETGKIAQTATLAKRMDPLAKFDPEIRLSSYQKEKFSGSLHSGTELQP